MPLTQYSESKRCARCGESFACGAAGGSCWCFALPKVIPLPEDKAAGCLCPKCLHAAIDEMQEASIAIPPQKTPL